MPQTWNDIIEAVDHEQFVGREHELARYRTELSGPPRKLIFFIHGQGGAGKTMLVNRYREIAAELEYVIADCDEQQKDIPAILGRFSEHLDGQGISLKTFNERWKKYRQCKQEIEADPDAPEGLAATLGKGAVRVGFILSDGIPIVRKGLELIGQDALETQVNQWSAYLAKKLTNKDEVTLLQDPVNVLSRTFFEDLNQVAINRHILLCFDNYEFTRVLLDDWILRLTDFKPSHNIRIVIAGRTSPGPQWDRVRNVLAEIPLDLFSQIEADEFLNKRGIDDPQRRQEIIEFSGRLPILMSWLASSEESEPDPTISTSDIVDRFLRWVRDERLRYAALRAVPDLIYAKNRLHWIV
jgi:hypothetical protein